MTYPQQPQYPTQPQQFQQQAPQGYAPAPQQPQFTAPPMPPQGYQQPQQGGFFSGQQQTPQGYGEQQPASAPARQVADTSAFFGGAPTISFDDRAGYQRGTFRGGRILRKEESQQTKMGTGELMFYTDNKPKMQLILTLATNERSDPTDTGERRLFLKGDMVRAARVAFQGAGAPDLEEGGYYYQAWTSEKAPKQAGWNAQKIYEGIYARPGAPDPMAGQPAYQAPAPAAPPAQQPYQPSAQAYNQAVAATGMDPQYATSAMQQAAYQAQQPAQFQPQAPAAPPQQFQQAAPAQDPQYAAYLAQQAQSAQQFGGQDVAQQAPAQPQQQAPQFQQAAPAAPGGGAPVGYNPFQQ